MLIKYLIKKIRPLCTQCLPFPLPPSNGGAKSLSLNMQTTNNLKSFNGGSQDLHVSDKACFYSAAKHVISSAHNELDNLDGYVMWLEDDWDLLIPFNMRELIDSDYEMIDRDTECLKRYLFDLKSRLNVFYNRQENQQHY